MFTGIIKELGTAVGVRKSKGGLLVRVSVPPEWKIREGESVAVNGICSTVKEFKRGIAWCEYMPETLRKTTASTWHMGEVLNLERSLRMGDALDGHMITGHVDGTAEIASIKRERASRVFTLKEISLQKSRSFFSLVAPKGSVAVDGVSLTVVDADDERFSVALIPYTLSHTNLGEKRVGDLVNVETDIIAKYLAQLTGKRG